MASDLADHIEAMIHAFPLADGRRDEVRRVAAQVRELEAEVERLRADPRLTLTADDLYVLLSWCPVGNETAGRFAGGVRRVVDALEEA